MAATSVSTQNNKNQYAYLYANTVRVVVEWVKDKNPRDFLGRIDIYEAFEKILSANELKMITAIGQQPSNNNWLVLFDKTYKVETLFGKIMDVRGRKASLLDPIEKKQNEDALRFSWLPPNVKADDIRLYLTNNKVKTDDIIGIRKEKCKNEKIAHLSSSTILVRLKKQNEEFIENLQGYHQWLGTKVCIERIGGPQKCFFCKNIGHYKKDCEKYKTKCEKCNGRGHTVDQCTLAKRIQPTNEDIGDHYHDIEMSGQVKDTAATSNAEKSPWWDRQNSTSLVDSTTSDKLAGGITIDSIANEIHSQKQATVNPSSKSQIKRRRESAGRTRHSSDDNQKKVRNDQHDSNRELNGSMISTNDVSVNESGTDQTKQFFT